MTSSSTVVACLATVVDFGTALLLLGILWILGVRFVATFAFATLTLTTQCRGVALLLGLKYRTSRLLQARCILCGSRLQLFNVERFRFEPSKQCSICCRTNRSNGGSCCSRIQLVGVQTFLVIGCSSAETIDAIFNRSTLLHNKARLEWCQSLPLHLVILEVERRFHITKLLALSVSVLQRLTACRDMRSSFRSQQLLKYSPEHCNILFLQDTLTSQFVQQHLITYQLDVSDHLTTIGH